MRNGRCRLHGGLSTGPRTALGREKSRLSQWKHGLRGRDFAVMRREGMRIRRNLRALNAAMRARIAANEGRPLPRGYVRWVEGLSDTGRARPDGDVVVMCLAPLAEALAAAARQAALPAEGAGVSRPVRNGPVDMGSGARIQDPPPPCLATAPRAAARRRWRADGAPPYWPTERQMARIVRGTLDRVRPKFRRPVLTRAGWMPAAA
jgi:hypothetical protein